MWIIVAQFIMCNLTGLVKIRWTCCSRSHYLCIWWVSLCCRVLIWRQRRRMITLILTRPWIPWASLTITSCTWMKSSPLVSEHLSNLLISHLLSTCKVGLNIVYVKTNYVTNEVICNGLSINMFTISYAVNFDCYREW